MSNGEGRPPIASVPPAIEHQLDYADPYTPPPTMLRRLGETSPFWSAARRYTMWTFAIAAMLAAIASWAFGVHGVITGSATTGILGFVLAFAAAVLVFVGDQFAEPGKKLKLSFVAGLLSVGSVLFVSFATVVRR